ncbi:uncharacterized protein LOC132284910 [Cornus florida]|uniref:uncharacterized protein LOC132284910 n=1 Tax=Cornus florida TaxID=4283 RepID=UPI0028A03629|nr:uncharacterized protein LOC132284910 [Cornus florida]
MAFSRFPISRSSSSNLFFSSLLRLKASPPMVAAARSLVARSIHTEVPPNHPHYEEIRRTVDYFESLMSAKHPFIKEGPRSPFFSRIEGDKVYRRVDMPGVGKRVYIDPRSREWHCDPRSREQHR